MDSNVLNFHSLWSTFLVLSIICVYCSLQSAIVDYNSNLDTSTTRTTFYLRNSHIISRNESSSTTNGSTTTKLSILLLVPLIETKTDKTNSSSTRLSNNFTENFNQLLVSECSSFTHACGNSIVTENAFDVGMDKGSDATPYSFPWQAIIQYYKKYICGGTIINEFYVLTAAHCISMMQKVQQLVESRYGSRVQSTNRSINIEQMTVLLGAFNTEDLTDTTEYNVQQYLAHPNHSVDDVHDTNDIALLKLRQKILYTSHIQPVCLPHQGEEFSGYEGVVVGWGQTRFNGSLSHNLKQAKVQILSDSTCVNSPIGSHFAEKPNSMVCAYGHKTDACKGDSGGPLLYKNVFGVYIQVGIISWGIGCAQVGYPGVYTEVSTYIEWMKSSIIKLCSL